MIYKKRERTAEELVEFLESIKFYPMLAIKELLKSEITQKQFIDKVSFARPCDTGKGEKIVDFLFEKEYKIGTFGIGWDEGRNFPMLGYYGGFNEEVYSYQHRLVACNGSFLGSYRCFEPLTEIPKYKGSEK